MARPGSPQSSSLHFEIARTVRVALRGADEQLERIARRELDPYEPTSDAGASADVTLEVRQQKRSLIDVQNPSADSLVTAFDGSDLHVVSHGWSCTVPRLAEQGPFSLHFRGFPPRRIFTSIVRPTIQLALEDHDAVATHSSGLEYEGRGLLIGGWSESGKTEAALAFMELGARFVSDKWTVLRRDSTIAPFPISVGIRRWALPYLPKLRGSLPRRARAQLAVAGMAATIAAPVRARRPRAASLELVRGALDRGIGLAERASLRPSDLAGTYGQDTPAAGSPLGVVVLLTTTAEPEITSRLADAHWAARRLARSASYERRAFFDLHRRARYAMPELDDETERAIELREERRLHAMLESVSVVEVKAPFPADPRRVADAVLARLR